MSVVLPDSFVCYLKIKSITKGTQTRNSHFPRLTLITQNDYFCKKRRDTKKKETKR